MIFSYFCHNLGKEIKLIGVGFGDDYGFDFKRCIRRI